MRTVTVTRQGSINDGCFGDWLSDSGFTCITMELPWLDNKTDISCIPKGTYPVKWLWSPHHNCNLYHIQNILDRVNVEIHSANVILQLLGCIAIGGSMQRFPKGTVLGKVPPFLTLERDMMGVTSSKDTLYSLEKDLQDENGNQIDFQLTIQ